MTTFTYRKNTKIEGTLVEETTTAYIVEIEIAQGVTDLVTLEKELTVVNEEMTVEENAKIETELLNNTMNGRRTDKKEWFVDALYKGLVKSHTEYKNFTTATIKALVQGQ